MTGVQTCALPISEAREWISKLNVKIDTINERTKQHTLEIRELRKEIREVKKDV